MAQYSTTTFVGVEASQVLHIPLLLGITLPVQMIESLKSQLGAL